jgi:hypothetical protein
MPYLQTMDSFSQPRLWKSNREGETIRYGWSKCQNQHLGLAVMQTGFKWLRIIPRIRVRNAYDASLTASFLTKRNFMNNFKSCIWFESFTVTLCNKVFSGDQPCEDRIGARLFGDCLHLHHQGLM